MQGRPPRGVKPSVDNPGKVFGRIMKYVFSRYLGAFIAVVLCIVISTYASIQGTAFLQTLIDDFITPLLAMDVPDYTALSKELIRVAIIYGIGILANFGNSKIMIYISQGTMRKLRDDMFVHMQTLPIKYFDSHAHGDIMSIYTNDVDTLRQMISQSIPQLITSAVTIVGVLIAMFRLSWLLTLVTLVMVALMLFVTKKVSSLSGKHFMAQQKDIGALNGYIEEMVEGQKVVKVFCHEDIAKADFAARNDQLFNSAYKANMYSSIIMPINAQLGNLTYVVVGVLASCLCTKGSVGITVGTIVAFLTYVKSFNMPINQISMQFASIIMGLAGCDRIFKLLDEKPEMDEGYVTLVNAREENGEIVETTERTGIWAWKHYHKDSDTTSYRKLEGDVVFDDVDFGYTEDKTVLHNIEIHAKPGQKIAFVGSTGAGKTTITNLISRFYSISDGKIRYDDININKIKLNDLRHSLGMVLQDTHLFTGTVMENIKYGRLDATDEEVYAAAKLANADSFIRKLPEGYNTMLKGDGANLSQGQRQLLAIARAAIENPPVLILDEATSSIDTRTEKMVQDGMDKLMKGRTTFVIAHRLSTVKNSDVIMVLEQGRIIEKGSHDELIALQGKYYQLYTGKNSSLLA